jgi:hypothetical protein
MDEDVVLLRPTEVRNHRLCRIWIKVLFLNYYVKNVELHGITYSMYYLVLRPGTGEPSNVDGVLAAYAGTYLQKRNSSWCNWVDNIAFEEIKYPQQILSLFNDIRMGEIFRCLKPEIHL